MRVQIESCLQLSQSRLDFTQMQQYHPLVDVGREKIAVQAESTLQILQRAFELSVVLQRHAEEFIGFARSRIKLDCGLQFGYRLRFLARVPQSDSQVIV